MRARNLVTILCALMVATTTLAASPPSSRLIKGYLDIGQRTSGEVLAYCQPLIDYWSKGLKIDTDNQQVIANCHCFFSRFVQRICEANNRPTDLPLIPFMQMWVIAVSDPQFGANTRPLRDTLIAAVMGSNICPMTAPPTTPSNSPPAKHG